MADTEKKYDDGHYTKLMECSDKKDMVDWNEFKKTLYNRGEQVCLEGSDLTGAYLKEASLYGAHLEGARLGQANLIGADLNAAHLEGADLTGVYLEQASLYKAHLECATLYGAHLKGVTLGRAHLEGADLSTAHLEGASLFEAHIEGANLFNADLQGANLAGTNLRGATLDVANLKGAILIKAHLEGTIFINAICDGETLISKCSIGWDSDSKGIERLTDFRGVGLDNVRFGPGLKQLVEYSNRLLNWEDWYQNHPRMKYLVKFFWSLSDYGRSTQRIVAAFFGFSLGFALLYGIFVQMTIGLHVTGDPLIDMHGWQLFWRSIYFSVVTMTTLGFGDIHADPQSIWGHIALTVQVVLGYVILGALVTRLSILFNADGPSADFSKVEKAGWLHRLKKRSRKTVEGVQESDEDER